MSQVTFAIGFYFTIMGIHHFTLNMVPIAYFKRIGSPMPTNLSDEDVEHGESKVSGWWASLQPTPQSLTRLRKLCPIDKSWDGVEEYVTGGTWGSDLRIWKDQGRIWLVTFRYSPVADQRMMLDQFVAIASYERCMLLNAETGLLFEPDIDVVAKCLNLSQAMRFDRDPKSTIIEASRAIPQ